MNDVLGQAMYDYNNNKPLSKLWIHNKYGEKEEMYVKTYFRNVEEMPDLELIALQNCYGKVLEIGAGAGSHALLLQQKNIDVTALEISPLAVEVMNQRGVKKTVETDIFNYKEASYDTIMLLMNGIGLTNNLEGLKKFLRHAKELVNPGGQLLFDSSDVAYLYDDDVSELDHYYGEVMYQYEYKKQKTDWFTWLYVDQKTLTATAAKEGWKAEILYVDEFDQYLAKLTLF